MRKCRILLFIFMVFLTACVPALPQDSMPTVDIPMQTINTVLQIKTPTRQTEFKANKSINLTVENVSKIFVALSVNCNLKVFNYLDTSWVEIGNKLQYFGLVEDSDGVFVPSLEGSRTLSPIMDSEENWAESRMSCDFLPVADKSDLPFMVRVFVSGNIVSGDIVTDEKTGAYIDILLK